jgi:multicomponent Na+:H+ antiporter subunit G
VTIILDFVSWAAILSGGALCIIGALGLVRLPDTYTRIHAASLIDTGGAILIVTGLAVQAGLTLVTVKLIILLAFLMFTSPTTTHALARALINAGYGPKAPTYPPTDKSDDGSADGR